VRPAIAAHKALVRQVSRSVPAELVSYNPNAKRVQTH